MVDLDLFQPHLNPIYPIFTWANIHFWDWLALNAWQNKA